MKEKEFQEKRAALVDEYLTIKRKIHALERKYALEKIHQAGFKLNQVVSCPDFSIKGKIKDVEMEADYPYVIVRELHEDGSIAKYKDYVLSNYISHVVKKNLKRREKLQSIQQSNFP